MKKIILIIFVLSYINSHAQFLELLQKEEKQGQSYNTNAIIYFTKATTLDDSTKLKISNLFNSLDDSLNSGARNKTLIQLGFDRLWLLANEDESSAKWDLTGQDTLSVISAMPFTAYQGYKGDGSTDYLNSNYNPSTDAVNYTQNAGSMFIYRRTTGANGKWCGVGSSANHNSGMQIYGASATEVYSGLNCSVGGYSSYANAIGLYCINRSASNAQQLYINGVERFTNTVASQAILNGNIYIAGNNFIGSGVELLTTCEFSIFGIGKSFNATEQRKIKNCLEAWMDANHKGIIP